MDSIAKPVAIDRMLAIGGLGLIGFGLAIGFAIPAAPDTHAALAAHLNGLQSGTLVCVLAILLPALLHASPQRAITSYGLLASFWIVEAGMTFAIMSPAAHRSQIADALISLGSLACFGFVVLLFSSALLGRFKGPVG